MPPAEHEVLAATRKGGRDALGVLCEHSVGNVYGHVLSRADTCRDQQTVERFLDEFDQGAAKPWNWGRRHG